MSWEKEDFFDVTLWPTIIVRIEETSRVLKEEVHSLTLSNTAREKFSFFLRLAQREFQGGITQEKLERVLFFIGDIFENFPVKHVYKSAMASELAEYKKSSLTEMFLNNFMIIWSTHTSLKSMPWGSCENRSIFFFELLKFLDPN